MAHGMVRSNARRCSLHTWWRDPIGQNPQFQNSYIWHLFYFRCGILTPPSYDLWLQIRHAVYFSVSFKAWESFFYIHSQRSHKCRIISCRRLSNTLLGSPASKSVCPQPVGTRSTDPIVANVPKIDKAAKNLFHLQSSAFFFSKDIALSLVTDGFILQPNHIPMHNT